VFRRLLLRRVAVMILVWLVVASAISLSRAALLVGVATLAVPALWAIAFERRAARAFYSDQRQITHAETPTRSSSDKSMMLASK
jgi:hypothetical protein